MNLRNLYGELRRRHVIRVTGVYIVGVWAVVQVASTVLPLLQLPETGARAVLIAGIIGLPITVLLAWFFDLTPEGIRRTADRVTPAEPVHHLDARGRASARAAGFVGLGILIALLGFAALSHYPDKSSARIESIAVLPFVDLSADHSQDYFTDGVTEEIMSRLAAVGLKVAARTSSFAFKGQNLEIDEIARRLNVQAVLEGSIRREGDSLRVIVKLVDARTQSVIWGDRFDAAASGIFAIQDQISASIVDALQLKLAAASPAAGSGRTQNMNAQELYFKGLKAWHEGTDVQLRAALDYFEQAVGADSTYALAFAGIARTYAVLPSFGDYPLFDALSQGKEAAARAIALSPYLGEAYAALGQIAQNLEWDLPTALQNYRDAIRATPNDATSHQWYAEALMLTGDLPAAATEVTRALELDPLSAPARNLRAYLMLLRADKAGALRTYQILSRESPEFAFGQLNFAFTSLAAHEYGDAARALVHAFPQFGPDVGAYVSAASGTGDRASARGIVERITETERPSVAALLYAAIGDRTRALDLVEQAYRTASDATLPYWLAHPLFDPMRGDKRFQDVAKAIGVVRPA
ncbi:MAG TPA: FlgO family outer membrane protein [Longimicrobiales bacterium]